MLLLIAILLLALAGALPVLAQACLRTGLQEGIVLWFYLTLAARVALVVALPVSVLLLALHAASL